MLDYLGKKVRKYPRYSFADFQLESVSRPTTDVRSSPIPRSVMSRVQKYRYSLTSFPKPTENDPAAPRLRVALIVVIRTFPLRKHVKDAVGMATQARVRSAEWNRVDTPRRPRIPFRIAIRGVWGCSRVALSILISTRRGPLSPGPEQQRSKLLT